jgi:hypothetical protein
VHRQALALADDHTVESHRLRLACELAMRGELAEAEPLMPPSERQLEGYDALVRELVHWLIQAHQGGERDALAAIVYHLKGAKDVSSQLLLWRARRHVARMAGQWFDGAVAAVGEGLGLIGGWRVLRAALLVSLVLLWLYYTTQARW